MTLSNLTRWALRLALLVAVSAHARGAAAQSPTYSLRPTLQTAAFARVLPTTRWAARRDTGPGTGMGMRIAGWALLGLGVLNLATMPLCFADVYPHAAKGLCIGLSAVVGGAGLAIGIPLLIAGYNQRAERRAWERNRGIAYHMSRVRFAAHGGGGMLLYATRW